MRKAVFYLCLTVAAAVGRPLAAAAVGESPASATATAQIHVTLVSATGAPLSGEGFVVFKGAAAGNPVVVPTKLPELAAVVLPAGSQWTLIADFPGYFAANSVLQVPRDASNQPLDVKVMLRPAGTLTGKLAVEGKEKLPESLEVRFEPTREGRVKKQDISKQDIPPGSAPCAIGSSGDWRCRLPAGRLDVALHPKGFVPQYLWNVDVKAGSTSPLGVWKLQRGASVAGWITQEDGAPAEKCRVRLEPMTAPGRPNDPTLEFLRTVASEVPCQKKGFFQLSGVRSGSYAIVAQQNDAKAQMSPVEVWEGAESRLTLPIVLRRPLDFEVTLSPPTDWLGRPWRVEALRANEYRAGWEDPSYRAEASSEGRVRIPKRFPGRFWIIVYDRLGNQVFSDPHVDLLDPSQPYPINIDLLWVKGTVRLGDQPVSGRLFFGGRSGAVKIEMSSDTDGRFEGPLPKPGKWQVEIEGAQPAVKTFTKVEVKKPKGDHASVDIDLPDTKVYGRVVDPSGKPAARAQVTLGSVGTIVTDTDAKGEFELRAFPEGTTELSAERTAEGGHEVSDTYMFQSSGDGAHGPVVLTLRRNRTIRGKVVAPTGPVIGATVNVWPASGGNGVASTLRTGLDGTFELKVPEGTQAVQAIVSPPGGALKAYEVNVSSDAELLLQVEPQGGDLVVNSGKNEPSGDQTLVVWQEDIGIPMGMLVHWAEGHGVRFAFQQGREIRIPQLAPGRYTVCFGAAEVMAPSELEAWKSRSRCASGFLAAASTLDLRLP